MGRGLWQDWGMTKLKWRPAAGAIALLAAAMWLPAGEEPKAQPPPAGPTLVFDADTKAYHASTEETNARFTFYVTNIWTNAVVIAEVVGSCHCTTAELPTNPWVLAPGASGSLTASVELNGEEEDELIRSLTVWTSVGVWDLTLEISATNPPRRADTPLTETERQAATAKATADPRAIFKGDCAACHVDKARGLLGQELYAASCGICHDSPKRASSVPGLRGSRPPADLDYWKGIIARGKPKTLMPGFAASEGGPLTELQVESLAAYLAKTMGSASPSHGN